jgi:hypothetical protein
VATEKDAKDGKDEKESSTDGFSSRVFKALSILFGVHLQFAQQEAKADLARIFMGIVLLAFALILLFFALAVGHVAAVWYVHDLRQLPWRTSILAVVAGDVTIALLCFIVARMRLKKPILKETRGLVRRTVSALVE